MLAETAEAPRLYPQGERGMNASKLTRGSLTNAVRVASRREGEEREHRNK